MAAALVLLDGGMGHEFKARGVRCGGELLSRFFLAGALANEEYPDIVQRVHSEYLEAGVDVITTNSFAVVPSALEPIGRSGDLDRLLRFAVQNAKSAVASHGRPVRIAGCLPPLQESYMVAQVPVDAETLVPCYSRLAAVLVAEGCEILLCETLSCVREAVAAVKGAATVTTEAATGGTPVEIWASVTLDDDATGSPRLRSGEPLADAIGALMALRCPALRAVLVNCCCPAAITAAMGLLAAAPLPVGMRFGGYANGFLTTTSKWLSAAKDSDVLPITNAMPDVITPAAYAAHCAGWVALGATIIGGCCGVSPPHMHAVAETLRRTDPHPPDRKSVV